MGRLSRFLFSVFLLALPTAASAGKAAKLCAAHIICQPGPTLDLNFLSGSLPSQITFTRASGATSALYTDAAAAAFATYTNNQPRLTVQGLLIEQSATNSLLNSGAPVTQTTGSLGTGSYVFFCNGTGSVTSSAGTATATGLGAQGCSTGSFQGISVTVAGTLTFTITGSVNWFDLQNLAVPTSHIITAGAAATRATDSAILPVSTFAWNPLAGAGLVTFIFSGGVGGSPRIIGSNEGTDSALFFVPTGASPRPVGVFDNTGSAPQTVNTYTFGTTGTAACSWGPTGDHINLNGGATASAGTNTNMSGLTQLIFGQNQNDAQFATQIWFQKFRLFNTQPTVLPRF